MNPYLDSHQDRCILEELAQDQRSGPIVYFVMDLKNLKYASSTTVYLLLSTHWSTFHFIFSFLCSYIVSKWPVQGIGRQPFSMIGRNYQFLSVNHFMNQTFNRRTRNVTVRYNLNEVLTKKLTPKYCSSTSSVRMQSGSDSDSNYSKTVRWIQLVQHERKMFMYLNYCKFIETPFYFVQYLVCHGIFNTSGRRIVQFVFSCMSQLQRTRSI